MGATQFEAKSPLNFILAVQKKYDTNKSEPHTLPTYYNSAIKSKEGSKLGLFF
jgi:hypothetical protein